MENLNKVITSFNTKKTLQPKIWENNKMNPKVRKNLLEIAYQFIDSFGLDVIVEDIIVTGSIANYNWSDYSDIDLHILVDYNQFNPKLKELYIEFFDLKKIVFNQKRNVKMFGFDVEVFVEDIDMKGVSGGVYSLMNDEWIKTPKKEEMKVSKDDIISGAKKWMRLIDNLIKNLKNEDIETIGGSVSIVKSKLKKFRVNGLKESGELGLPNLIFKVLRRNGYIDKLYTLPTKYIDKNLSLTEGELASPLKTMDIGARFGVVRPGLDTKRPHSGVDFRASTGTPIFAPADGEIKKADMGENGGCGGSIFIKHKKGLESRFCHSSKILVKVGDKVKQGQQVGLTGGGRNDPGRGFSTGAHLHYTLVKDGNLVDPLYYIDKNLVPTTQTFKQDAEEFDVTTEKIDDIKKKIFDYDSNLQKNEESIEKIKQGRFITDFEKMLNNTNEVPQYFDVISKDENVERVQIALQYLGFLNPDFGIDGYFDEKTYEAVNDFQKNLKLSPKEYLNKEDLLVIYYLLVYNLFDDSKLSKIVREPNYQKLKLTSMNNFYQMVLIGLNAEITYNNLNLLKAWNDATTIGGEKNPFGLKITNESDKFSPLQNTINTLKTSDFLCLRDKLIKNRKIDEILSCPNFDIDLKRKIKSLLKTN